MKTYGVKCVGKAGVPRNRVQITCRACKAEYLVNHKELRRKANAHRGWYPCDKCGSWNTTWEFGEDED